MYSVIGGKHVDDLSSIEVKCHYCGKIGIRIRDRTEGFRWKKKKRVSLTVRGAEQEELKGSDSRT